jgi:integrase
MRGDGRLYPRGAVWWVEYWHHGKQVRESAKTTDREAAEKFLRKRTKLANTPHFVAPSVSRVTFEDLAEAYLRDYRLNGRRSLAHAERRVTDALQPGVVNRELSTLRRMFSLAVKAGRLPHRPHIALLDKSGSVREGFLEPAAFVAIAKHLPSYLEAPARFAYPTAWRVGAVRALEWRDVDLQARTLLLRASSAKNKRAKHIPLSSLLLAVLTAQAEARDPACPYVQAVKETGTDGTASVSGGDCEWRRAESNRGPRDYETLALAY